jgi:hypothetical protein
MPQRDALSRAGDIISFILSFMYKLTVQLAIEFLKYFSLLAILFGFCGVFGIGFVSLVVWAYVAYESSLVAAAGAAGCGVVLFVLAGAAVQFVVRDVLHLTDVSLLHLAKVYFVSMIGRRRRAPAENVAKLQSEPEESSTTDVDQKTKKDI